MKPSDTRGQTAANSDGRDEILQTISLLFELSLSIGGTLDVETCIMRFAKQFMKTMNLSHFSLWLDIAAEPNEGPIQALLGAAKRESLPPEGFVRVFTHPVRTQEGVLIAEAEDAIVQAAMQRGFSVVDTELPTGLRPRSESSPTGVTGLLPLGALPGFVEFGSLARSEPFPTSRLNQMRPLMEKFGTAIAGAAAYQQATEEVAKRRMAEEKALRTNAAKTFFLANMNHEMRTPLNAMMGYAQLLSYSTNLNAEDRELVTDLLAQTEALTLLITRLMDLTQQSDRLDTVQAALFSPVDLVEGIVARLNVPKSIELRTQLCPTLPDVVTGDASKLTFVLEHALENALKFTEQGHIQVEAEWDAEKRLLQFAVADTGIGLQSEQAGEAFTMLETLGRGQHTHEGAGVGLTIAKRMIDAMGGHIEIEGALGEGATLRWQVPCLVAG